MSEVTRILTAIEQGNAKSTDELLPVVYNELRRMAAHKMLSEPAGHTLQPTALVHEAWLQLVDTTAQSWQNRAHFLGAAAEAMRRLQIARAEVPAHRDPTLAIELAKKAVELNAQSSNHRNTLGIARYRAGDWKQATSDLEKSVSLGKGGNSFDFFFLAMAHWKLGDKDEARQWYERATSSMDKQQPNQELRRFQTEAEELMKESPVK